MVVVAVVSSCCCSSRTIPIQKTCSCCYCSIGLIGFPLFRHFFCCSFFFFFVFSPSSSIFFSFSSLLPPPAPPSSSSSSFGYCCQHLFPAQNDEFICSEAETQNFKYRINIEYTETRNSSGNTRPQSSQLSEPLWTDLGLTSGTSVRELISTFKKRRRRMNGPTFSQKSSQARKLSSLHGNGAEYIICVQKSIILSLIYSSHIACWVVCCLVARLLCQSDWWSVGYSQQCCSVDRLIGCLSCSFARSFFRPFSGS